MQIFLKGLEGKTTVFGNDDAPVNPDQTIRGFRKMIWERIGITEDKQLLIFAGKPL